MRLDNILRIALLVIAVWGPALLVIGQGPEFPMDDAYIHLQYARNLAETGRLEFNPGEFRGLGTTSMLWVLLLAGGIVVGLDPILVSKLMGIVGLVIVTLCVFELARPMFGPPRSRPAALGAFVVAALGALSGNVIWFALSGMETMQFLALGLLALVFVQRGWWWGVGISAGLAAVCRPEGMALFPVIVGLEALRLQAGGSWRWRRWAFAGAVAAVPVVVWSLYTYLETGNLLPTTFEGKRVIYADVIEHILDMAPALALYTGLPQVMTVVLWLGYLPMYALGVAAFPGPALHYTTDMGTIATVRISLIGALLVAAVAIPLVVLGVRRLWRFVRSADRTDPLVLGVLGVWIWAVVHNLTYLVLLPQPGTATRYQAINHLLLWWLLALGLVALWPRRRLAVAAACALALIVAVDVGYWRGVYAANLDHMREVRIAAARYLARETPPGARVAAYDIGALRYFGERTILDLGGLTDTEFVNYERLGRVDHYLKDRQADYVAVPAKHSTDEEGMVDIAQQLGIIRSPLYTLIEVAAFETPRDLWLRGVEATGNYQPSVRVYRIEWQRRNEE